MIMWHSATSGGLPRREPWDALTDSSRDAVWQRLRALRAEPPGGAAEGERRWVFGSALEQAGQLFTAAAGVDFASRPLLLFYGLSQAGRAIAAAATAAQGDDWKLKWHGITARNLDDRPPLHELTVINTSSGSFTQLAPLLGSGTLPGGAPLGQVWLTIPDLTTRPLDSGSAVYVPPLRLGLTGTKDDGSSFGWLTAFPLRLSSATTEQEVADLLDHYPSLAGHAHSEGGRVTAHEGRPVAIPRRFPPPEGGDLRAQERRLTQPYLDDADRWVFPVIGGGVRPLHPLLAWWAVLFALSMLARYEPASWTGHLDVDRSPDAVPLESALTLALDTCPLLVLRAIQEVSA